ncbi:hypothetical protein [Schlesneria paludicola]|uniref:hypothetical protein n=1 Tax=Schlesneria paludicola TaxID=360056 RepID=UPI00029A1D70|nr:hypothetical protein [Schlesneria paludicola]
MLNERLAHSFFERQEEAHKLAGGLAALSRRATLYRHLYLASRGNHTFPLIAAHGALWSGGYFRFGMSLGSVLSWQYFGRPERRRQQQEKLVEFADVFREINRRVCIDSYVNFHFSREFGQHANASDFIPSELLDPLNRMHAAIAADRELSEREKQIVFEAHFRHEQAHVVGPTLIEAVQAFDWPLVREIALRPRIRFAYFPGRTTMQFCNFASQAERLEKGMTAFTLAAQVGWSNVDAALRLYRVLPDAYFSAPFAYFNQLRSSILAMS